MTGKQIAEAKAELGIAPAASEVFGRRYNTFIKLVEELQGVNEIKSTAEAESRRLNGLLQSMWADVGHKTVLDNGTKVTLVTSKSADRIEAVSLIEQGVSIDVIQKATVEGKPYKFVKVTPPKEK
jgi:hypothetical protein